MADEPLDFSDEVTQVVLRELSAVYGEVIHRLDGAHVVEFTTVLETRHVRSVIRYMRGEGLIPYDKEADGNGVAVIYLIKHLYGILQQAG